MARNGKMLRWLGIAIASVALILLGAFTHAQLAGSPPFATVTYRGYLELDGSPVDGQVDLEVRLFDAQADGNELTTDPMAAPDVEVDAGHFSTSLTLPAEALGGAEVWLALAVDDGSGLIPLQGRQRLTSVPYSLLAQTAQTASEARAAAGALRTEIDGLVRRSGDEVSGSLTVAGDLVVDGSLRGGAGVAPNFVSGWYRIFDTSMTPTTVRVAHGFGRVPSQVVLQWARDPDPASLSPPPSTYEPQWVRATGNSSQGVIFWSPETLWLGANEVLLQACCDDYVIYCDENNLCPDGEDSTRSGIVRVLLWR